MSPVTWPTPADAGDGSRRIHTLTNNFSTADQTINAATSALLTGSTLPVPAAKLQIGSILRFWMALSKTNAGTAANTFIVRLGTTGTINDAAVLTFTLPLGTGVVDTGDIDVVVTVRGPLSASGKLQGYLSMQHNLAATGLSLVPIVGLSVLSGNVDLTVAGLIASVSCTTAASTVLTFQQVLAELINA